MLADAPVWDSWRQHIPQRPLSADVLADGMRRRPRQEALQYALIEFNTAGRLSWLLFDHDEEDSFGCWERAGLPKPNFYAQNRSNGHGHLGYQLQTPVGLLGLSRERPIRLAADVQRGMTRRLGADPAFANRFGKNPSHGRWASSWFAARPYDLGDLLVALDRRDLEFPSSRAEISGISRNCDLFDVLRQYAYANVRAFKSTGYGPSAWRDRLLLEARGQNIGFACPLTVSELRQIAQSVARWTWRRFSEHQFAQIQAHRAKVLGQRRGAAAEANADAVLDLIRSA
jgi:Replicase family/Primase C terminal 1 (PriCT-1)